MIAILLRFDLVLNGNFSVTVQKNKTLQLKIKIELLLTNLSPYFSQSSFICLKSRVVVPHKLAVFSTRTTLPFRLEKLN